MNASFLDLEIRILPKRDGDYPIEIHLRDGGDFKGSLTTNICNWVASGNVTKDGQRLFAALFADSRLRIAWAEARGASTQRRVRLCIDTNAPELHGLPWELLHDNDVMLSANAATPFSRYLPVTTPWGSAVQERPIRVLAVISNPLNLADTYNLTPLDVEKERANLEQAFTALSADAIKIDFLEAPASLERLEDALHSGYHILHYLGHGALNRREQQAVLYFQDGASNTHIVSDEIIVSMLAQQRLCPRLIFLAACQSAMQASGDAFLGLAPRLVSKGIPAVIAIRDNITIQAARKFSQTFYRQLAQHGIVDLAMNEARSALLTVNSKQAAIPVLFMRLKDGKLFNLEVEAEPDATRTVDWNVALETYREWVERAYGTMRVLGKHEPVSVEGIYTDVYLLEKPVASRYLDPSESPNRTKGKRHNGLKLVMQPGNERLVILGQPGAGKTTFLKHIALQAAKGELGDYVPILVYLREWAGNDLMDFLAEPLASGGLANPRSYLEHLLRTRRALLLLDGLDEVSETERRELVKFIERSSRRYSDCRILLTCRVAATPYQFERFKEVEVANFTDEQMQAFVSNWFGEDMAKAREFLKHIKQDRHLYDLSRTPLLLGMLCLVFDEPGAFPQKRADLYRRALDTLLVQWDESRNIERDAMRRAEIYHELSPGRKHQMFAQIAYATFEQGEMLIPKERLERLIADYLVTIPNTPARVDIDSAATLKAIEAQHGILVEYARGAYAFLHPTFQEYYAACYVVAQAENGTAGAIPRLLSHAHEERWREVILLTATLFGDADTFFQSFQENLDKLINNDRILVSFLQWLADKSSTTKTPYKLPALKSFYCYQTLINIPRYSYQVTTLAQNLITMLDSTLELDGVGYPKDYELALDIHLYRALSIAQNIDQQRSFMRGTKAHLSEAESVCKHISARELNRILEGLDVPEKYDSTEIWYSFADRLRAILVNHRNIGHNWSFAEEQIAILECYLYAIQLLVQCLNVARVTNRAAIEDHLLLSPEQKED